MTKLEHVVSADFLELEARMCRMGWERMDNVRQKMFSRELLLDRYPRMDRESQIRAGWSINNLEKQIAELGGEHDRNRGEW